MTEVFSSNPYVAGFDPLNEPAPSWTSISDLINTVYPGHFDKNNLAPLYTKIYNNMKKSDKDGLLWFEPSQTDGIGIGTPMIFNAGFETPPGANVGSTSHVLNDHTYCCQLSPGICAGKGEAGPELADKCLNFHTKKISTRALDAKRLGIPLHYGEFGACMDTDDCVREINQVADLNEQHLTSGWAYWEFKKY